MSNKIVGELKMPETVSVHGKPGTTGVVSVKIKSLVNRETKASEIQKRLKNGWDWNKFTPVVIAVFPDGRKYLLDGDHRRAMFCVTFPRLTEMPCHYIEVADEKEYHRLFVQINYTHRKNTNGNEVFIHEVLAEDPTALKIQKFLQECNLCVYGSPEEHGTVGDLRGKQITIGAFKQALAHGINHVKYAVSVISDSWPSDSKVKGEFLEGVTILLKIHNRLRDDSTLAKDFKTWFKYIVAGESQSTAASTYKGLGGRVHHRHAESIAHGLITKWRGFQLPHGPTRRRKQKLISLEPTAKLLKTD